MTVALDTPLPLTLLGRGKVRDVYAVGSDRVLLVASDRVSAFDVVMRERVPLKGIVLTQMGAWWFAEMGDAVPHHLVSAEIGAIVGAVPALAPWEAHLAGRAMLCRRTEVIPIECVIRGYLAGSGWAEYRERGTLAGEPLPAGLAQAERLPAARFTPATKAASGHDVNIAVARLPELVGPAVASELERRTRLVYARAVAQAAARGIIIADTKLEFGHTPDGELLLIDELLTPDSSRFWAADAYRPGGSPPSFDKQPLRDYLAAERSAGRWNGEAPAPPLPRSVIEATTDRYLEAYRRITGHPLDVPGHRLADAADAGAEARPDATANSAAHAPDAGAER